jgi:hypothetical protein
VVRCLRVHTKAIMSISSMEYFDTSRGVFGF